MLTPIGDDLAKRMDQPLWVLENGLLVLPAGSLRDCIICDLSGGYVGSMSLMQHEVKVDHAPQLKVVRRKVWHCRVRLKAMKVARVKVRISLARVCITHALLQIEANRNPAFIGRVPTKQAIKALSSLQVSA